MATFFPSVKSIQIMVSEGVCVCCGTWAGPLCRQYSLTVLKLTECKKCQKIADKYLEYDIVIILIDLILLSKEAIRHVLYNTTFEMYWKLFIFLLLMQTYITHSSNNHVRTKENKSECIVNTVYNVSDNVSHLHIFHNNYVHWSNCDLARSQIKGIEIYNDDDFIIEKTIYLVFIQCFIVLSSFFIVAYIFSIFMGFHSLLRNKVDFLLFCKGFILAKSGNFLFLPAIIWGSDQDKSMHLLLVFIYTFVALTNVHSDIFQCRRLYSFIIIFISYFIEISLSMQLNSIFNIVLQSISQ